MKPILITSLLLNVVFMILLFNLKWKDQKMQRNIAREALPIYPNDDFRISNNFVNLYVNKNDSIYKQIWRSAYEDKPTDAFLISSTYYFVTKNKSILKDVEMSKSQVEEIYGKKIIISKDGNGALWRKH